MNKARIIDFKGFDALKNRDAVRSAFRNAFEYNIIWVDFAHIKFLSRTAAHEILTIKKSLNEEDIDVSFANLSSQVNEMLDLVENSSNLPKDADFRFVKWLSFKNQEDYKNYLLKY